MTNQTKKKMTNIAICVMLIVGMVSIFLCPPMTAEAGKTEKIYVIDKITQHPFGKNGWNQVILSGYFHTDISSYDYNNDGFVVQKRKKYLLYDRQSLKRSGSSQPYSVKFSYYPNHMIATTTSVTKGNRQFNVYENTYDENGNITREERKSDGNYWYFRTNGQKITTRYNVYNFDPILGTEFAKYNGQEFGNNYTYGKNWIREQAYGVRFNGSLSPPKKEVNIFYLDSHKNIYKVVNRKNENLDAVPKQSDTVSKTVHHFQYDANDCLRGEESDYYTVKYTYKQISVDKNLIEKVRNQQWCIRNLEYFLGGINHCYYELTPNGGLFAKE